MIWRATIADTMLRRRSVRLDLSASVVFQVSVFGVSHGYNNLITLGCADLKE